MFLPLQNKILEMIARGRPLRETAVRICLEAERLSPTSICTILAVDETGRLRPLAAPGLPPSCRSAFDGVQIGPDVGSCGAAAFRGAPVAATDIANDPFWKDYKALVLPLGLAACWSSPIFSGAGQVIGTFAFYFPDRRGPSEAEEQIVATCLNLCTIALERHEIETENRRLAYFDALTGLGNRANFDRTLADAGLSAPFGLLLIDVDHLKLVNDAVGHLGGDELLREIAGRIGACAEGCAFRLSGDEFGVIVQGLDVHDRLAWVADGILEAMRPRTSCNGRFLQPAVTIGGAIYDRDGGTVDAARHNADVALYHAKDKHRGGFVRFSEGLGAVMTERFQAIRDVQDALEDGRVEAYYQPVVLLETSEIVGVEALCRVWDGDGVRMPEALFQHAMTDDATAARLSECMLTQVARAVRSWLDAGVPFQHVGVNVAAGDFLVGDLEERLSGIFERLDVPLRHVILEVTELVYMGKTDLVVAEAVKALRSRGLLVALDDFGTGYASLTHLLTFPVDIIKIDRSFVADLQPGGPSSAIVGGMIDIARKLGMRVVAEGVETAAQAQHLRQLGCRLAQGYHYARPGDFASVTRLLLAKSQRSSEGDVRTLDALRLGAGDRPR